MRLLHQLKLQGQQLQMLLIAIAAKNPKTPIPIVINITGARGFNSTISLAII